MGRKKVISDVDESSSLLPKEGPDYTWFNRPSFTTATTSIRGHSFGLRKLNITAFTLSALAIPASAIYAGITYTSLASLIIPLSVAGGTGLLSLMLCDVLSRKFQIMLGSAVVLSAALFAAYMYYTPSLIQAKYMWEKEWFDMWLLTAAVFENFKLIAWSLTSALLSTLLKPLGFATASGITLGWAIAGLFAGVAALIPYFFLNDKESHGLAAEERAMAATALNGPVNLFNFAISSKKVVGSVRKYLVDLRGGYSGAASSVPSDVAGLLRTAYRKRPDKKKAYTLKELMDVVQKEDLSLYPSHCQSLISSLLNAILASAVAWSRPGFILTAYAAGLGLWGVPAAVVFGGAHAIVTICTGILGYARMFKLPFFLSSSLFSYHPLMMGFLVLSSFILMLSGITAGKAYVEADQDLGFNVDQKFGNGTIYDASFAASVSSSVAVNFPTAIFSSVKFFLFFIPFLVKYGFTHLLALKIAKGEADVLENEGELSGFFNKLEAMTVAEFNTWLNEGGSDVKEQLAGKFNYKTTNRFFSSPITVVSDESGNNQKTIVPNKSSDSWWGRRVARAVLSCGADKVNYYSQQYSMS